MTNKTIQLKVKQRLNKLDSQDYDNFECWKIVEAFNKGQVMWCRRNLVATNQKRTGDEQSKRRIDDLQILLKNKKMSLTKRDKFVESGLLPKDYFEWKRVSGDATNDCCKNPVHVKIYLAQEADVDILLADDNYRPSFDWGETFCTLKGNRIKIYTDNDFTMTEAVLTYYRQPLNIQVKDCVDPYTGITSTSDVECEFKDDIVELFIDEAVKILAGDIESFPQRQVADSQVETNN